MYSNKLSRIWIFLVIGSSVLTVYGAKKPPPTQILQIQQFTTAENVTVTDKYMQSMMKNIVKQLTGTKRFQTVVLGTTGSPVQPTQPGMILLTGELLEFSPGKRAARYFARGLAKRRRESIFSSLTPNQGNCCMKRMSRGW